jgi:hypothetical protein
MFRSKNTFNFVLFGIIILLILILINNVRSRLEPVLSKNIKTYSDLINEYGSIQKTPGGIPKLIIKTSWQKLNNLPPQIEDVLNTTIRLNPDYRIYYFDDDDIIKFMKSYGEKEYAAYNKLIPGAYKADFFRYCILYKYGGCYSDIGHVMLKSFDYIIRYNKLVIVKDKPTMTYSGIHNALICVTPFNEFIKNLVDLSVENIENNSYGEDTLDITGPIMMGKVFQCYYSNYCNKPLEEKYLMEKEGIKILDLALDYTLPGSDIGVIRDNGVNVLKTKFDNYTEVMYTSSNKKHYGELWHSKKVYNN